jgi:nitrile hydratase
MNGVHDMGGMAGLGAIDPEPEQSEPVFHHPWEGRVYGINRSLFATGRWNIDEWRHQIERLPAVDYLRKTYYERWLAANERLLIEKGLVTSFELATGRAAPVQANASAAFTIAMATGVQGRKLPPTKDPSVAPRFAIGQTVRARIIHPAGHTRLPRYARGKTGVIAIDHGVHRFPDSHAHGAGERRQHLYAVRFTARNLWGDTASAVDTVSLDLWDDHLENT